MTTVIPRAAPAAAAATARTRRAAFANSTGPHDLWILRLGWRIWKIVQNLRLRLIIMMIVQTAFFLQK